MTQSAVITGQDLLPLGLSPTRRAVHMKNEGFQGMNQNIWFKKILTFYSDLLWHWKQWCKGFLCAQRVQRVSLPQSPGYFISFRTTLSLTKIDYMNILTAVSHYYQVE